MLVKLDDEAPLDALPTTRKARIESPETRDTTNPEFVTQLVMGFLRGIGQPVDIKRIHKNTREEILGLIPMSRGAAPRCG